MTRVGIMQPYFLPYIGYWQLLNAVDDFVVYDNIQFSKRGWINRNRFLSNGGPAWFSLPLKKASDFHDIRERELSVSFDADRLALLRRMESAYRKAPFFDEGIALVRDVLLCSERNLFSFVLNSIELVKDRLSINTNLVTSSSLDVPSSLKGQNRVIATCKELGATEYLNPIGGTELYERQAFHLAGLRLRFHRIKRFEYAQFNHEFVPNLSIVDMVMFLGFEATRDFLTEMVSVDP